MQSTKQSRIDFATLAAVLRVPRSDREYFEELIQLHFEACRPLDLQEDLCLAGVLMTRWQLREVEIEMEDLEQAASAPTGPVLSRLRELQARSVELTDRCKAAILALHVLKNQAGRLVAGPLDNCYPN
jgi:hypothetical protein